jgi:hypothetical protein
LRIHAKELARNKPANLPRSKCMNLTTEYLLLGMISHLGLAADEVGMLWREGRLGTFVKFGRWPHQILAHFEKPFASATVPAINPRPDAEERGCPNLLC